MNVLQDLALWICTRRGTLDLKTSILHSSPASLDQDFCGEWWNCPIRMSILRGVLLLVGGVHRRDACYRLQCEWGGNLLICGALLHCIIPIKDQTVSYWWRQDSLMRLALPPEWDHMTTWKATTSGNQQLPSLALTPLQIKANLSKLSQWFLTNFILVRAVRV